MSGKASPKIVRFTNFFFFFFFFFLYEVYYICIYMHFGQNKGNPICRSGKLKRE